MLLFLIPPRCIVLHSENFRISFSYFEALELNHVGRDHPQTQELSMRLAFLHSNLTFYPFFSVGFLDLLSIFSDYNWFSQRPKCLSLCHHYLTYNIHSQNVPFSPLPIYKGKNSEANFHLWAEIGLKVREEMRNGSYYF